MEEVYTTEPHKFYAKQEELVNPIENALRFILPIIIISGDLTNILTLFVLIRRRLWQQSEGYIYLGVAFIVNIVILTIGVGHNWLYYINHRNNIMNTSNFLCKVFPLFLDIFSTTEWFMIGFFLDVYMQRSLGTDRGHCTSTLAAKFCRRKVAWLIVCIVFGSAFVVSMWSLWGMELGYRMHYGGDSSILTCQFKNTFISFTWLSISPYFYLLFPVNFLLPLLSILIATAGGKRFPDTGSETGSAFDSYEHFPRAAVLCLALVVFLLASPLAFVKFLLLWFSFIPYSLDSFLITQSLIDLMFIGIPVICLLMMPKFREELKQLIRRNGNQQVIGSSMPLTAGHLAV